MSQINGGGSITSDKRMSSDDPQLLDKYFNLRNRQLSTIPVKYLQSSEMKKKDKDKKDKDKPKPENKVQVNSNSSGDDC